MLSSQIRVALLTTAGMIDGVRLRKGRGRVKAGRVEGEWFSERGGVVVNGGWRWEEYKGYL
jgi:hypothetical protein